MRHLSGSRKIYGIGSLVLGVLLLLWPGNALRLVGYVAGFFVMAGGITSILAHFRRRPRTSIAGTNLIIGTVVTIVGGWIFTNPVRFASILPTAIGYLIILSGIVNLLETFSLSRAHYRNWWVSLLAAVATIFMGTILVNHAFGIASTMVRLVGLFLIFNGVSDLWINSRVDQYVKYDQYGLRWTGSSGRRNTQKKARAGGGAGTTGYDTSDPDIIDAENYREL